MSRTRPERSRKVCMLVTGDCTRDGRTLKEAKALTRRGLQVVVLAVKEPNTARLEQRNGIRIRRADVLLRRLPKWPLLLPAKLGEFALRTLAAGVAERADVYHAHALEPMVIAWAAARLVGARLVFDSRELTLDRMGYHGLPGPVRRLIAGYERAMARRADAVLDVTPERAALLSERCGIPTPPVVGNYPEVRSPETTCLLRETLGLPEDTKIALYQGLFRPDRGLAELVEAMERVPEGLLVLMGFGAYRSELERMVQSRGLSERVRFAAAAPPTETVRHAASADVGLVTLKNTCLNNYYAAPSKLYDYLMAGLPVIVSDFPGLRAIAEQGAGIAVDPESPEEIAEALNRILSDDALRRAMARRARELAETEYNWERASRVLLEVYDGLLAGR